ncbi:MAG: DNA topoisomerase 3 [Deltaproteobacteria bacterium]
MKGLIITEKPSVALDLSRVLPGPFSRNDGWLEGDSLLISWALGHLLELAMPEDYDPALGKWDLAILPFIPPVFHLKPRGDTLKQLETIRHLAGRQDVGELINACDAGREGELIFRNIMEYLGICKPHRRLWLSETTPAAIRTAFLSLRSDAELVPLGRAASARSQADWIVGINATRAYSAKNHDKLTVGRVQTPTLALLVQRETEIEAFVPVPYWELEARFIVGQDAYTGKWFRDKRDRFDSVLESEAVLKRLIPGTDARISSVEQKDIRELPPQLFNLNELQKEANKKWGNTAEETLNIAQRLYEKHLLTYPRTDSRYLTAVMAETLPARIKALAATDLAAAAAGLDPVTSDKRYVNDARVSDHTAIIITDTRPALESLTPRELDIYMLVARRLLGIFMPPAHSLQTTIITLLQDESFITRGKTQVDAGWKILYPREENEADEVALPLLKAGQDAVLDKAQIVAKESQAPRRYTEAALLSAMENAGRQVEDSELREVMRGKGLGTPATRAAIIEKLIETAYVVRKKKLLVPTEKGRGLIELVDQQLKDPEMTGEWEKTLLDIEQGYYDDERFLVSIKDFTIALINGLKKDAGDRKKTPAIAPGIQVLGTCPLCGNPVIESPRGYSCSGWREGCKFVIWKTIAGKNVSITNARRMLKQGRTNLIKGFKSKKGGTFNAFLKLDGGEVLFEFSEYGKRDG